MANSASVCLMRVVGVFVLVSRAVQHQQQLFLSLFLISLTALHTHTLIHTERVKMDFLGISRRT